MGASDLMEIPGFRVAAGKRIGAAFTNTPLSHCQTELCAAEIRCIVPAGLHFPPGQREEEMAAHFRMAVKEKKNTITFYLLSFASTL